VSDACGERNEPQLSDQALLAIGLFVRDFLVIGMLGSLRCFHLTSAIAEVAAYPNTDQDSAINPIHQLRPFELGDCRK